MVRLGSLISRTIAGATGKAVAAMFVTAVVVFSPTAAVAAPPAVSGTDDGCPDVELIFARGTGEPAGLGSVGIPFVADLAAVLPGRTLRSYGVNYPAQIWQTTAEVGAVDLVDHIGAVARVCQDATFVLGGYSQGALVVDVAIGVLRMGDMTSSIIPPNLSPRIVAAVVFGNPLGLMGRTIAASSEVYGPKTMEFCNTGDPVCGAGFNVIAHTRYSTDGSTATGARFVAQKVNA
jgi:cutinase